MHSHKLVLISLFYALFLIQNSNNNNYTFALNTTGEPTTAAANNTYLTLENIFATPNSNKETASTTLNPTPGCIDGNAFTDYDSDGSDDLEPGVQGVEVRIYNCDNSLAGTTYSDSEGDWQLCGLTNSETYRVEFILSAALANDYRTSQVGTDNKSDVQFTTPNNSLKFGLSPADVCGAAPFLLTTCFNFGGYQGAYGSNDAFVGVQSNRRDDPTVNSAGSVIHYATHAEVGSTYGVAVNSETRQAYISAYMKRHAGFGPGGTGAIYQVDLNQNNSPTVLADLNSIYGANTAGVNPHDFSESTTCPGGSNFNCWFNDVDSWNAVGHVSLGDMDISTDESTLYVMNLNDRNIYQVDLANPTAVQPTFPFPLNQATDPNVTMKPLDPAYDMRPFGMKYHNDLIYVGAIDSGQSKSRDGICCAAGTAIIYVYTLDPNTGAWSFVFQEEIQRGGYNGWFFHWEDEFRDSYKDGNKTIVSDIEFDGDDMILGLRDLSADKYGSEAGKPIAGDSNILFKQSTAGDIIRFCYDGTNYNFENNGSCGGNTTTGANSSYGWPEASSPRGSYYSGDYFSTSHPQTSLGGLWLNPSDNRVYSTVFDLTEVYQAGIKSLDNTTGAARESYILVANTNANGGFGKTAGLGDLEAACIEFTPEIGNYVWRDEIENGIQDACEEGISDILVQLYDKNGLLIGQDYTDDGHYSFNKDNVDTTGVVIFVDQSSPVTNWSGMSYSTQYFIVFGAGQFNTDKFSIDDASYEITPTWNTGSNDNIDSDINANNLTSGGLGGRPDGLPFIELRTPATGSGDHRYDMGLIDTPLYSLGNQVFNDTDNSGDLNGSEAGIDGVQLQLLNASGTVYDSDPDVSGIQALTVTTANGGYYRFDELPAGSYIIEVIASNFNASSPLENLISSTGTNQEISPYGLVDSNDNGLNAFTAGAIRSSIITLNDSQPLTEIQPASYNANSITGEESVDEFSNLTIDFGFYNACSITVNANTICDENGTFLIGNDDTFAISIQANTTGNSFPNGYSVLYNGAILNTGNTDYGETVLVSHSNFLANGSSTFNLVIQDVNDASCQETISITAPNECSTGNCNLYANLSENNCCEECPSGNVDIETPYWKEEFQDLNSVNLMEGKPSNFNGTPFLNETSSIHSTDGRFAGDLVGGLDYSFSAEGQDNYWYGDLVGFYDIETIRIHTKAGCCGGDAVNYQVFIANEPFNTYDYNQLLTQTDVSNFSVSLTGNSSPSVISNVNTSGRFIRIYLEGTGQMQLIEVEIIGSGNVNSSPYSYDWNSMTIGNISNPRCLPSGPYQVVVTDISTTCSITKNIVVE